MDLKSQSDLPRCIESTKILNQIRKTSAFCPKRVSRPQSQGRTLRKSNKQCELGYNPQSRVRSYHIYLEAFGAKCHREYY